MIYLLLFWEFLKIGLFTLGGGLASLPFLYELAGRYDWFTKAQVADMVAVAECTPGPLAINMATYAGVQAAGIPGGVLATTALIIPSILISLLVSTVLAHWAKGPVLQNIFSGIRPAVSGLLSSIALSMVFLAILGVNGPGQAILFNYKALIFFILLLPAVFRLKKHPIVYVALGAVVGLIFRF
ncbi:MAG: chromate transporter [Bacillota bacterium]|nr:chromate transporter [Bacillota bacterium]